MWQSVVLKVPVRLPEDSDAHQRQVACGGAEKPDVPAAGLGPCQAGRTRCSVVSLSAWRAASSVGLMNSGLQGGRARKLRQGKNNRQNHNASHRCQRITNYTEVIFNQLLITKQFPLAHCHRARIHIDTSMTIDCVYTMTVGVHELRTLVSDEK